MDRETAQIIIEKALSFSDADETEILFSYEEENLTRFSDNAISQNVARKTDSLTVKVHIGKKVGRATTNKYDSESLVNAVRMAKKAASPQKENPELLPLSSPSKFAEANSYYDSTAKLSPEDRAKTIKKLIVETEKSKAIAAGIYSTGVDIIALGNSKGLFAYYSGTNAILSSTVELKGSSGWAETVYRDVEKIRAEKVAEISIKKAKDSQNAQPLDPGVYTVVLEPAAVADFMMFFAFEGFGGLNFIEGRSFLSRKLGEQVLGENVTIVDDAYHPLNSGLPFDFEGSPRKRVILIENGIARQVVHDRITAKKADIVTTGHSLPQPNSTGPLPLNLMLEPGDSSLDEMILSTKRGILVTHFHYTNVLDPVKLTLTGMTRDGTFLIENGKISRPIQNFRFTESIVEAFRRIEMISKDRQTVKGFFAGNFIVPALKITNFHFTSTSEF